MHLEENNTHFVYDIAFSFAGEQREYVSKVYRILKDEYGVKVFYDQDIGIQADLWGKDLAEEFQKIYENQSRYCLIFISKEYKDKIWTRYERKNALVRAIREKGEYILPARFDGTEIEGILSTTCYIDISVIKPEDFSQFILLRLGISSKQKDTFLTDSELPDVRVNVYCVAYIGYDPIFHQENYYGLSINVSNHGRDTVFLKYPKIALKKYNVHIPIFKNDFNGNVIAEIGKLEYGNSFDIFTNPSNYSSFINQLDYVFVDDNIGRRFKGNQDELNKALDNWHNSR